MPPSSSPIRTRVFRLGSLRALAGLTLCLGLAGALPASTLLRFQWPPGRELRYRLDMKTTQTVRVGPERSRNEVETRLFMTQRVLAAREGSARIFTRVESGRTRSGRKEALLPPRESTMRMNDLGTLLGGDGASLTSPTLNLVFPERPLGMGDSWFNSLPPSEKIPIPITVRYTLVGRTHAGGESCLKVAVLLKGVDVGPTSTTPREAELRFSATGTILYAYQAGFVVSSEVHADLSLAWKADVPGGDPILQEIQMDYDLRYLP